VSLPTAQPGGNPINDRIWVSFFPANRFDQPAPAVVLLHPLGEKHNRLLRRFARYLTERGIGAAVMTLPYHMQRLPPHDKPQRHFATLQIDRMVQSYTQSASDVSTVVNWLVRQPSVNPRQVGVIGVSLGAIIAHLAMGQDERLTAGVAILGGGNLADLYQRSLLLQVLHPSTSLKLSPEEEERLRSIDPLTYAHRNRPRKVLMIQAARDLLIPPADALLLWEALGRPPVQWLDTNHYALLLATDAIMKTSTEYLLAVWSDPGFNGHGLTPIHAPTLKLGFVTGLDAALTPALQWQVIVFATSRDHMSLLHANLGWSGRGAFLSLAITLNAFLDVGLARRFHRQTVRPYASFHIVF